MTLLNLLLLLYIKKKTTILLCFVNSRVQNVKQTKYMNQTNIKEKQTQAQTKNKNKKSQTNKRKHKHRVTSPPPKKTSPPTLTRQASILPWACPAQNISKCSLTSMPLWWCQARQSSLLMTGTATLRRMLVPVLPEDDDGGGGRRKRESQSVMCARGSFLCP